MLTNRVTKFRSKVANIVERSEFVKEVVTEVMQQFVNFALKKS